MMTRLYKSWREGRRSIAAACLIVLMLSAASIEAREQRLRAHDNVRAVWVRPFIGADAATRGDERRGRAFIRRELERLKAAGFDTVYVESFFDGYSIYPSRFAAQRPLDSTLR